jgi:hypothetical protein
VDGQLKAIRDSMESDFPLADAEAVAFREQLAEQVLKVGELERAAHAALQAAMAGTAAGRKK